MIDIVTGGWHVCGPEWRGGWRHEPHSKLYVVRRGTADYDCGAGWRTLRPGRIHLIPGDRRHRYRCPRRMELWWLHVLPDDQRIAAQLAALRDLREWPQAGHRPRWTLAEGYVRTRPWPATLALSGLLLDLLADLPPPGPAPSRRLAGVAEWLEQTALRNPPLAEIARQAGLSPSQLTRLARVEWGETPHARVVRLRLQHARALLLTSDLTLAAIARRCAYADAPTFSKAFRARHGQPPDGYRRHQGGQAP